MAQALYRAKGQSVDYTPGADVAAGQVVVQNGFVGVANRPIPANTLGALTVYGVFSIVKAAAEGINAGAAVYWDADGNPQGGEAGSGCLTATAEGNTFAGYAIAAAGANDERLTTLLHRSPSITAHETISVALEDPGDTEEIAPVHSGHVALVTAGAETRDLADPEFVGQQLLLSLDTDGGDCVVSAASPINQAGNNTLTFDNAGESILLVAASVGGEPVWRVAANDGVGLSTVE